MREAAVKNIWLGNAALAALVIAGPAQAADLQAAPVYKAPPVAIASSWTGFYAGLGLGFRASRTDVTTTSLVEGSASIDLIAPNQPFDGTAFRASPYAGFNWQFASQWVAGIEGDAGLASQTTTLGGFSSSPGLGSSIENADSLVVKATWDANLRGRLGVLLTPTTLAYVTGGAAWQHFDMTSTCGDSFCASTLFTPVVVRNSATRTGWTAGGGIETALWGHWLARAEYRYADFGAAAFTINRSTVFGPLIDSFNTVMRTHAATFGLAYKFGDPIASGDFGDAFGALPVGKMPALMMWNGFYAGLGIGVRTSRSDLTTTSQVVGGTPRDFTSNATSLPFDGTGFRASPYLGFNWQFAPRWVTGIEGDAGFANQTTTLGGFPFSPAFLSVGAGNGLAVKTTWDASLRGRFGLLLTPATLAYATGGAAWQHYDVTSTCVDESCVFRGFAPAIVSNSTTKGGWTIGSGLEAALWRRARNTATRISAPPRSRSSDQAPVLLLTQPSTTSAFDCARTS
jgi:outer membrane immunogenic protein